MLKKIMSILICCLLVFTGCGGKHKPINETAKETNKKTELKLLPDDVASGKGNYEVADGEIAEFLSYNYPGRSLYIAGLKAFKEFSTRNEGSATILKDENALTFGMTKSTGTVSGALDGPQVYFKMDLATNKITEKKFEPAPNYAELGITEFTEHSNEMLELTDERMVEIGLYFKELIGKIEAS